MVERALLVGVQFQEDSEENTRQLLEELEELVQTLKISVVDKILVKVRDRQSRYLLGSGKMAEIVMHMKELKADCLVFDAELTPAQQRNWETESKACVIDRQEVILDIFGERARTREAVLQVELARAEHSLPRLKNAWTHLSRQRGGGAVTQRGEGEAQIELDQRMVRQRISRLKQELSEVIQHRDVQRKKRQRVPLPTVAIVGYTNAGKSTLLNRMTGSTVLSEDKLFATLDPTTRQLALPSGQKILATDTVGFVRRLPHALVDAFRATLEEALVSNFLIHVLDASNPEVHEHYETTLKVLKELGAEEKKIITVYNKVDRVDPAAERDLLQPSQVEGAAYVSARTGEGIDGLIERMESLLEDQLEVREICVPHDRYDVIHELHQAGAVKESDPREEGVRMRVLAPARLDGLIKPFMAE